MEITPKFSGYGHEKLNTILFSKVKGCAIMEEQACVTGDVIDSRYGDGDGDIYFLMEDSVHRFTISLKEIFECLKFAEENNEIEPLPKSFWIGAMCRYPDMYRGKEYEGF